MSLYASLTALQINMVGVTFDTATSNLAFKQIKRAEAEVNKYLSRRYDISSFNTTTSIPPLVKELTEQLAEGYCWLRMSRGAKESISRAKEFIKPVIDNLKDIRDYKADLVDINGDPLSENENSQFRILSSTEGYSSTFNEDDPLNWKVDSDKLDDIDSERD